MLTHDKQALSFGLKPVDDFFPGFRTGEFAVLHGNSFCKTLFYILSIRCQLQAKDGGLNSSAIYFDGGNTFDPYGISAIAQDHELDPQSILERIFVSRAFTAYQLSALITATEDALKQYGSKLALVSDITGLFLDKDLPTKESMEIFNKAVTHLSNIATKRNVIIIASAFPTECSRRQAFLEAILFGTATTVMAIAEPKGQLQFTLERHPFLNPFSINIFHTSANPVTLEKFTRSQRIG